MKKNKPWVSELIVVEGRDDERAIKEALEAEVIVTNGFHISKKTMKIIKKAYEGPGIIIFTDPDHSGEIIRARLSKEFPKSKHAFLHKEDARKKSDIGVENASASNIQKALLKTLIYEEKPQATFSQDDLIYFDLIGSDESSKRRNQLGKALGIGYANGKTFLSRLNNFAISREDFYKHGQALFSKNSDETD